MQESKNKLAMIENEIERRKKLKLNSYNVGDKIHHKQVEFHKCQKRNRWVFGGNRSGKTECGAVETVWLARGIHPYRQNKKDVNCWVVSLSNQVQRDVAQQKILSYLDPTWIAEVSMLSGKKTGLEYGVIDYIIIKNVFGGTSKIGFKSCEAGREKFQGTSLDFVWFDEEPPKDIYEECKMQKPDTLCLVLPYDTLDCRAIDKVLSTRVEYVAKQLEQMDEYNQKLQNSQAKQMVQKRLQECQNILHRPSG